MKAVDMGNYFRVPLDTRDLNYSVYFEKGRPRSEDFDAYTSHNTMRLEIDAVKELLLTIPEVSQELAD